MKKLLFLFLIMPILSYVEVQGQDDYVPLPEENVVWKEIFHPYGGSLVPLASIPEGDTLINGLSYKKVYHYKFDSEESMNVISKTYVGGFRNDIENKKVYYYPIIDDKLFYNDKLEEKILYDFNLQLGDTLFATNSYLNYMDMYVVQIDTIQAEDGSYRKAIGLWIRAIPSVNLDPSELWWIIEGIGLNRGLLYKIDDFDDNSSILTCMYNTNENGTVNQIIYSDRYYNSRHTGCSYISSADIDFKSTELMHIYPNPIEHVGCVRFKQAYSLKNHRLTLYNMYGKKVKTFEHLSEQIPMISSTDYAPGMYLLTLSENQQVIETKKIIIK